MTKKEFIQVSISYLCCLDSACGGGSSLQMLSSVKPSYSLITSQLIIAVSWCLSLFGLVCCGACDQSCYIKVCLFVTRHKQVNGFPLNLVEECDLAQGGIQNISSFCFCNIVFSVDIFI